MVGINPAIREKIKELIGDDAPNALMDFFDEVLKTEEKQERTGVQDKKELERTYQSTIDKYSQDKKIITFMKSKMTEGDQN